MRLMHVDLLCIHTSVLQPTAQDLVDKRRATAQPTYRHSCRAFRMYLQNKHQDQIFEPTSARRRTPEHAANRQVEHQNITTARQVICCNITTTTTICAQTITFTAASQPLACLQSWYVERTPRRRLVDISHDKPFRTSCFPAASDLA